MKFTILINQKQVSDAKLIEQTDLTDWAIIDYIAKFYTSPKAKRLNEHVWINLKTLCDEMPLLKLKTKQAASNRISKIRNIGMITCVYDDNKRMYARITQRCYEVIGSSEAVHETYTGCTSGLYADSNPVHETYTGCTRNHDIKQTSSTKPVVKQTSINKKEPAKAVFSEEMKKYGVDQNFIDEILKHRRSIKSKKPTPAAMNLILLGMSRAVEQRVLPTMEACLSYYTTETIWQGFKADWIDKQRTTNHAKRDTANQLAEQTGRDPTDFIL